MTLSSGPVEVSERVLRAQSRPVLHHSDPAFIDFFESTCTLLQRVFRTRHAVVILQGETVLGLEAAAASMISPGDKVLNVVSGVFAKAFGDHIRRYEGQMVELAVPYNEAVDPEAVREALRRDPEVKLLAVVHAETPSGTVNPVREIAAVAREHGALTVVDAVATLGGDELHVDDWGVDIAVAGPQKCLGGPPGLSLLAVSPAAWEAMERRKPPLRGSFLSILDWKDSWLARRVFPYTPSVSLIYALESALAEVLDEGLERRVSRHALVARAYRAGVKAMGLQLWPAREEIASSAVTSVAIPEGVDDQELRRVLRERYGVMISGGYGELAGKLFRLGHMARAAHPAFLAAQLALLERSLADLGWPVKWGEGVGAAMAALEGWGREAGTLG
jgi:pyridoxamine--pyruvate transaminase